MATHVNPLPHPDRKAELIPLLGAAVSTVLAAVKIVAGILGHSYALVADGIESGGDVAGSLVVWTGLRLAAKPADADHPYGHGRAETIAAVVSALALLAAGAFIGIESIERIRTPHELPRPWTLLVLAGTVAVKLAFSRVVAKAARVTESTALKSDALHHLSDALTSGAAFIGIGVALLVHRPGWEKADDWAALVACLIVLFNGTKLLLTAVGEFMDPAAPRELEAQVRAVAGQVDGVREVEKCKIRKSGLSYFVDLHVVVDGETSVRAGHEVAHRVQAALRDAPTLRVADATIHVEPHDI